MYANKSLSSGKAIISERSDEDLERVQGSPILNPARSDESAMIWKEMNPFLGAAEIKEFAIVVEVRSVEKLSWSASISPLMYKMITQCAMQ